MTFIVWRMFLQNIHTVQFTVELNIQLLINYYLLKIETHTMLNPCDLWHDDLTTDLQISLTFRVPETTASSQHNQQSYPA